MGLFHTARIKILAVNFQGSYLKKNVYSAGVAVLGGAMKSRLSFIILQRSQKHIKKRTTQKTTQRLFFFFSHWSPRKPQ